MKHYEKHFVSTQLDEETGIAIREDWKNASGRWDRPGDLPAIIIRDRITGAVMEEHWHKNGKCHRESAPSKIMYHRDTGAVCQEMWMKNNKIYRDGDLPDATIYDPVTQQPVKLMYNKIGEFHGYRGPVILHLDPHTGAVTDAEYWTTRGENPSHSPSAPKLK